MLEVVWRPMRVVYLQQDPLSIWSFDSCIHGSSSYRWSSTRLI
jgi:hypothetical protein